MSHLDIANTFNAVSREASRSVLESHGNFCALLPLFDILCSENNLCWHPKPDRTFANFQQAEGFAQGFPLVCPSIASLAALRIFFFPTLTTNNSKQVRKLVNQTTHALEMSTLVPQHKQNHSSMM
jgi:hypothetical protein